MNSATVTAFGWSALRCAGMERPSSRPLRVAWFLVETRRYEIAGTLPSGRAVASWEGFGPAGWGKTGLLISCGAAVICGGAVALVNFGWSVGQQV